MPEEDKMDKLWHIVQLLKLKSESRNIILCVVVFCNVNRFILYSFMRC